jgi:hypothetical protein
MVKAYARTRTASEKLISVMEFQVGSTSGVGRYEVPFGSSRLRSGLYFYRLRAGSFTETRRMLVVR